MQIFYYTLYWQYRAIRAKLLFYSYLLLQRQYSSTNKSRNHISSLIHLYRAHNIYHLHCQCIFNNNLSREDIFAKYAFEWILHVYRITRGKNELNHNHVKKTHFSFQPFQLYFFYPFDIIIILSTKKNSFNDCLSGNVKYLNFISKIIYYKNFTFSRLLLSS